MRKALLHRTMKGMSVWRWKIGHGSSDQLEQILGDTVKSHVSLPSQLSPTARDKIIFLLRNP